MQFTSAVERLAGVDLMILDCLRKREHPTHLSLSRSVDYIRRIGAKRGLLVHMCHDITHEEYARELPDDIQPAYDGLVVEF